MSSLPSTVATADFAALVGLTPRRIQQLVSEKLLPSAGHGKMVLADALQAFVKWRVESEIRAFRFEREGRRKRNGDATADGDLEAERIRKLKLENDATERLLIPNQIIEGAFDLLCGPLLVDFAGFPAQITDDIDLRRKMEDGIDALRGRHADRLERVLMDVMGGRDPLADEGGEEEENE